MRLKVGDTVLVRRGKDKGKSGKILEINRDTGKLKIDGINKATIHKKPASQNVPGGLFEEFMFMDASKVGIAHPSKKGATTRLGIRVDSKGNKKRIMKANSKEV